MLVFGERGKPEYPEKITSQSREENQQTQPTCDAKSGWKASVLTTVPTLLPKQTVSIPTQIYYTSFVVLHESSVKCFHWFGFFVFSLQPS